MKGYVHIYCGDGKGKTTAAVGLAVRAAGRGKKVLIARFLKTDDSGEVPALQAIPGITVIPCIKSFGFYFQMTEEQKKEAAVYYGGLFRMSAARAAAESCDLLILDEILAAVHYRLVDEREVVSFIETRPPKLEVALTGRGPSEVLTAHADYISEIRMVRHPYVAEDLPAREGIEY